MFPRTPLLLSTGLLVLGKDDQAECGCVQELVVYGSQEPAEVSLEGDAVLYFKPTCVHTTSTRSYGVRNLSRLPINFRWTLKHSDSSVLSVHPTQGTIQPNETQVSHISIAVVVVPFIDIWHPFRIDFTAIQKCLGVFFKLFFILVFFQYLF